MLINSPVNKLFKKVPIRGAFFIGLLLLAACANSNPYDEQGRVKYVIDGDTLVLDSGVTVRFVGINTPELGHGKFKDEPLASEAKHFVEQKLEQKEVLLRTGVDNKDRYGRLLAHVITKDGLNIQSALLERGLGFAVAVGDNLSLLDHYLRAEQLARDKKIGVWADNFYAPISARHAVKNKLKGYRQISGKVARVSQSRKNQTLHLKGGFRVFIPHEAWKQYFKGKPKRYVGKRIISRGWVFKTHDIVGMKVYHPAMIEI